MTDFDLDTFLPHQLAVVAARVSRDFAAICRDRFGLSIAEWRVIAQLGQSGPVSVREIHLQVDMDKSEVSRAAARLQAAGLVTKSVNPADRRLVSLALTAAGQRLVDDIAPLARAFEAEVIARMGQDGAFLRAGLQRLMQQDDHRCHEAPEKGGTAK